VNYGTTLKSYQINHNEEAVFSRRKHTRYEEPLHW
jgi:hypothetical protein